MEELDEAITLTTSAFQIAMQQMRRQIGFTDQEDGKFDDWMSAASATLDEAKKAITQRPTNSVPSAVDEARKELEAEYARILPDLYGPGGKFAA